MEIPIARSLFVSGAIELVIDAMRNSDSLPYPFEITFQRDPVTFEISLWSLDSHAQTSLDIVRWADVVADFYGLGVRS